MRNIAMDQSQTIIPIKNLINSSLLPNTDQQQSRPLVLSKNNSSRSKRKLVQPIDSNISMT